MWENTKYVGCAQVFCKRQHKMMAFCQYGPPGNVLNHRPYSFKVAQRIQKAFARGSMLQNPKYPECDAKANRGKVFDFVRWQFVAAHHADRRFDRFKRRGSTSSNNLPGKISHQTTHETSAERQEPATYDESLQREKALSSGKSSKHK
jgi:hypothetical protein